VNSQREQANDTTYDVVVVGAGTAGIPCALAAAKAGARVLLLEKDSQIGGTLHVTGGHMAAAGARRQIERGIQDTPEQHLEDIRRISHGTARDDLIQVLVANAADTVDWFDERGFAFASETPRIIYGHEPYRVARTYYGKDEGLSILEVLKAELDQARTQFDITVWTNAPVTEIRRNTEGRICGVSTFRAGEEIDVDAPSVVIATGGFASDSELFEELEGSPLVSAASKTSTGDGIHLGRAIGAGLQGRGTYLPSFGGLPDPKRPGRANWSDRQLLTSERPPLEIYVNTKGQRWVTEDEPSIDVKERALTTIPQQTFWTVFDDAMLDLSTGPNEMVVGCNPDQVRAMANTRAGVHSAQTLEELAAMAGIDPQGLVTAVVRYNTQVARGVDEDFGRKHLPMPIEKSPFYAIRNHAITLVTFIGLDIDTDFTVRAENGQRIEGLYAVGEIIGAGATCGNSFCSGMLVTPALTFGRLLGEQLGAKFN